MKMVASMVIKRQDGQCAALNLHILHIYISIYLHIYLFIYPLGGHSPGGGWWSVVRVCSVGTPWPLAMCAPVPLSEHDTYLPPTPSPPPLFSVYILHCVHMSSHQTPAHWREIRSDHYILILPRTYTRYTVPCVGHVLDISYWAKNEELQIGRQWQQCNVTKILLILAVDV